MPDKDDEAAHKDTEKMNKPTEEPRLRDSEDFRLSANGNHYQVRIKNSLTILQAYDVDSGAKVMILLIYAAQFIGLISAIVYAAQHDLQKYNMPVVALGNIYATIAIISSGYGSIKDIAVLLIADKADNKDHALASTPLNYCIINAEFFIIILTIVALVMLIPQQGDIVSIVLNCTGIISVSQLDDQFFSAFHFECRIKKYMKDNADNTEIPSKVKTIAPVLLGVGFYISVVWLTSVWITRCDNTPSCAT